MIDIFQTNANVLVNPVNRRGVMGAGLAKQFAQRYPGMFASYQQACYNGWFDNPFSGHVYRLETGQFIYNFPTKVHWADKSTLGEIDAALIQLRYWSDRNWDRTIALPRIGCGLGGLDWRDVSLLIVMRFEDCMDRLILCQP